MTTDLPLPAADLLPQTGDMCLLEHIVSVDDESLVATTSFAVDSLFCRDGRVGSWVGLECMAQAVAAWAGYQGRRHGLAPRIGFLLGTSRFECLRPWLGIGEQLRIEVKKEIQMDDGLGQFTGQTFEGGEKIASAIITVFSPEDPLAIIRGASGG